MTDILIRWPVSFGTNITQYFGENPAMYPRYGGHNGIDLGAFIGTPVRACARGKVIRADWDKKSDPSAGYGKHIRLQHANGYSSIYGHLSVINVSQGDEVDAGHTLGLSGSTGWSTGPHLHFELRRGITPIDPLPYLLKGAQVDPAHPKEYVPPRAEELPPTTGELRLAKQVKVTATDGLALRLSPRVDPATFLLYLPFDTVLQSDGLAGDWMRVVLFVHRDYVQPT